MGSGSMSTKHFQSTVGKTLTESQPFKRGSWDSVKDWWHVLKRLHKKYKMARLHDDIPMMIACADAIRILQDDGDCKIEEFPELQQFNHSMRNKHE